MSQRLAKMARPSYGHCAMGTFEANFDGLVGPTHNYAGLSRGNVASKRNAGEVAHPRRAARQGLDKMKFLSDLGLVQGMLPPHARPDLGLLRRLGFTGAPEQIVERASQEAPVLLAAAYSASSMWTANAATAIPSSDTTDHRLHLTPANLENKLHRSIEHETTGRVLGRIFAEPDRFQHHPALPSCDTLGDEGAANHTRLAASHGGPGLHLFVYGRTALDDGAPRPSKFPARQTREASEAVARLSCLASGRAHFLQQNPAVIDQGVFHNDVIAVGNLDLLFCHEEAFLGGRAPHDALRASFQAVTGAELRIVEVPSDEVSVADAVSSYLFNSQLLSLEDGAQVLLAPIECEENASVKRYLDGLVGRREGIDRVHYLDVRESMKNGGGPACLRLRVVMTEAERRDLGARTVLDPELHAELGAWIDRSYREDLAVTDLRDPALIEESQQALDELTQILNLGSVYPFQLP